MTDASARPSPFNLEGRAAFVTGAASGIGRALAAALKAEGAHVALADINAEGVRAAAEALGGEAAGALALPLDVTDRAAYAAAREATLARFGRVDVVCNVAGVGGAAPIEDADFKDWDWIFGVNFGGVVNGVVTFLPDLKARPDGAHLLNLGSILSTFPQPGPPGIYGVTKKAILALSDSLRFSLKGTGVGVTTVCPGYVDTAIALSEATRPAQFATGRPIDPEHQAFFERLLKEAGMSPEEVAARAVAGIKANAPYVMTHPEFAGAAQVYADQLLAAYGPLDVEDPGRAATAEEMTRMMRALTE